MKVIMADDKVFDLSNEQKIKDKERPLVPYGSDE